MPMAAIPSALKRTPPRVAVVLAVLAIAFAPGVRAAEVKIAAAANFTVAAKEIAALFEKSTGHKAVFSFGSTGQLFTQITQDAPFEVFLAADRERPAKAITEGHAVAGSQITYATGRIALFSADRMLVAGKTTLDLGAFDKIAIANPKTAPYGAAAIAAMQTLGVYGALEKKIVQGNNIAQTYQFVMTGNAQLGFVALSQIAGHKDGSRWIVPASLYPAIAQDAVLLKRGGDNPVARDFLAFLKGPEARAVKDRFGYGSGD